MWINYTKSEWKKLQYATFDQIALPLNSWIGLKTGIKTLRENAELVHKIFLIICVKSNLSGADDHLIQSETCWSDICWWR